MIEIEIDGKKIQAQPNSMVIQAAEEAGIYIPRFCYHKHLTVAANCRMCLVEVEKAPKPMPACATPVAPGLKVFTRSPKAIAAQKAVMEFLLINHPLDCPICDQGGECELQDLSMGYGSAESYFVEGKRSVADEDLGPLIATEMTRCIQCTRCVRFGEEIAGFRELGAVGRGEEMEISTYIPHAMRSEVSGNIIDLCPVGALTSKPYRFTARPWELNQSSSISPHDCAGSNIHVHTRYGKVMRVVSKENNDINQTWISDRDRFSYQGLNHSDRLGVPLIRHNESWQETDWETALSTAVERFKKINAQQIGALASPNSTLEEFYLLQKLFRSLGSNNIDHRLRQMDFSDQNAMPLFPGLSAEASDLAQAETILLIGSNIQKEQPILSLRLRKAALNGAKIAAVNMVDYDFHFPLFQKIIAAPQHFISALEKLDLDLLKSAKKSFILIGASALNHPHAAQIRAQAHRIANETGAKLGFLTEGANCAGAWIAGAVPHRGVYGSRLSQSGSDVYTMLRKPLQGYMLLNIEPEYDFANSKIAINALAQAECVVALSIFRNPVLEQYANVILPIAPFTETSGTFVNFSGRFQKFRGAANSFGDSRPAWKVLRVLGNLFNCSGFEYDSSEKIIDEIKSHPAQNNFVYSHPIKSCESSPGLHRIGEIPIYCGDSMVRRAKALQAAQVIVQPNLNAAHIHPGTAQQFNLKDNELVTIKQHENQVQMPVFFNEKIPRDAVWIAGGIGSAVGLGDLFGSVEVLKCKTSS